MCTGGTITEFISNITYGVLNSIWAGVWVLTLNSISWASINWTWLAQSSLFWSWDSIAGLWSVHKNENFHINSIHLFAHTKHFSQFYAHWILTSMSSCEDLVRCQLVGSQRRLVRLVRLGEEQQLRQRWGQQIQWRISFWLFVWFDKSTKDAQILLISRASDCNHFIVKNCVLDPSPSKFFFTISYVFFSSHLRQVFSSSAVLHFYYIDKQCKCELGKDIFNVYARILCMKNICSSL